MIIAPSILSCDFTKLGQEVTDAANGGADWIHADVMDGHFVPNISFGIPIVESLKRISALPLDVHLMISNPLFYAPLFAKAGADFIVFHLESSCEPIEVIKEIKKAGIKAGISIKPKTPPELVFKYLEYVDLILIMMVEPGFGGQTFMTQLLPKITRIKEKCLQMNVSPYIQVDGGINEHTARLAAAAGADVLVAGSAVFNSGDYQAAIKSLRGASENACPH
jgi:ribulose-phosphate 3-epimerase